MDRIDNLNFTLLDSESLASKNVPSDFASCLNARGLYNTNQFVLRLNPRIHQLLEGNTNGVYSSSELDEETIQAFATYLHETVHWWQHIGSTTGLMLSLAYPAQTHANSRHIREFIAKVGPVKSIKSWVEDAQINVPLKKRESTIAQFIINNIFDLVFYKAVVSGSVKKKAINIANIIVNNVFDMDFFKAIIISPDQEPKLYEHKYFESAGHSFHIAYTHAIDFLSSTLDRSYKFLPDVRSWEREFIKLRNAKVPGYYYGSPIIKAPLGLYALFEGRARFIQLQYLAFGGASNYSYNDFKNLGMLSGIYVEAFNKFLEFTGASEPKKIDDPIIGLFLLVCDISINPTAGFPNDIENFEHFLLDTNPGIRFTLLCKAIKEVCPETLNMISFYTTEEYINVSDILCDSALIDNPRHSLKKINGWLEKEASMRQLMQEYESFNYNPENLVARVVFSHFLAFTSDKLNNPEFFCWAGAWMAGKNADDTKGQRLFLKHLSLFSDKADDGDVFPRNIPGKDYNGLMDMFNRFFASNMIFDLTRQFIINDGPFICNFGWLTKKYSADEVKDKAIEIFGKTHNIDPEKIKIL